MTEQLQTYYLHRYEDVQAELHEMNQFYKSSFVTTTYLENAIIKGDESFKAHEHFAI